MSNAGLLIRCYREKYKISIRDLSKTIGVEHTCLYRFENGEAISHENWVAIMKWVLTGETNQDQNTNEKS